MDHPRLVFEGDRRTQTFTLEDRQTYHIGRHPDNDIVLPDDSVSRFHCAVAPLATGVWIVRDLVSRSGTAVNGRRVSRDTPLRDGDVILVGECRLRYADPRQARSAAEKPEANGRTTRELRLPEELIDRRNYNALVADLVLKKKRQQGAAPPKRLPKVAAAAVAADPRRRWLHQLGMTRDTLLRAKHFCRKTSGMLLIASPSDARRDEVIAAVISEIDPTSREILAFPDLDAALPPGVRSAAAAGLDRLDDVLGHTAPVILFRQMLEPAEWDRAVAAANRHRLVLASAQAGDAVTALQEAIADGASPEHVARGIRLVIAVREVPGLCPLCRISRLPTELEEQTLASIGLEAAELYESEGCRKCNQTGRAAPVAIYESLKVEKAVRDAIRGGGGAEALQGALNSEWYEPWWWEGMRLATVGRVSVSDLFGTAAGKAAGEG